MRIVFVVGFVLISLSGCNSNSPLDTTHPESTTYFENIRAYIPNGEYSTGLLEDCAKAVTVKTACTLKELPFIGMEKAFQALPQERSTAKDTIIELVLERLAISHTWMGERFEEILEELPLEILYLFRALTFVVIDADIRPSYFLPATGGIYLDADYLWQTIEEKNTINQDPDHRSKYASKVPYTVTWNIVHPSGTSIFSSKSDARKLEDTRYPAIHLLLHEITHANDAYPMGKVIPWYNVSPVLNPPNPYETWVAMEEQRHTLSWSLRAYDEAAKREDDSILHTLALALYGGGTPPKDDKNKDIEAPVVGEKLALGGKVMLYSYYSLWEDVAMLVEASMLKHIYDMDILPAITITPEKEDPTCSDYTVIWASKNRIGNALVKERAKKIVDTLYEGTSNLDLPDDEFYSALAPEQFITEGMPFCVPLTKGRAGNYMPTLPTLPPDIPLDDNNMPLR